MIELKWNYYTIIIWELNEWPMKWMMKYNEIMKQRINKLIQVMLYDLIQLK